MLQAAALQSAVVETLKARVSADNALALWSAGERLAMPDVVEKATSTALSKFADLASSGSLLEATYEQLLALVQDDHLDVKTEDELFKAVASWVDHYNRVPAGATPRARTPLAAETHPLLALLARVCAEERACMAADADSRGPGGPSRRAGSLRRWHQVEATARKSPSNRVGRVVPKHDYRGA